MDLLLWVGVILLVLGFGGFVLRLALSIIGGLLLIGAILFVLGLIL